VGVYQRLTSARGARNNANQQETMKIEEFGDKFTHLNEFI